MKHTFFPILLALVVNGKAQQVLRPENNELPSAWIRNDTSKMNWYIVNNTSSTRIGQVITRTQIKERRILIITEVELKGSGSSWIDSSLAESGSGKPVYHSSYNAQRNMVLEFGNIVTGWYYDKTTGANKIIRDTTGHSYFDSNFYPSLIAWLPIKEGYQQDLAIYDFNPATRSGIATASIKEVRSGQIETGNKLQREVWIVTVTDGISSGTTTVFSIDKLNRKLWRQEITSGNRRSVLIRENE